MTNKKRKGGGIKNRNICQSEILILKINVVGVFIFFLQTWFNNRRVKARNEFDRKKSKDRRRRKSTGDVTYKKMQQTTTPDWRVEQMIDPSDKRVHHSQKERKRAHRKRSMMYIPHRRALHPDRAAEDLVMERDAELIDDKEYHEILYDSDW